MADNEFQYVKLPDGSYGKFPGSASDDQIRSVLASQFPKDFAAAKAGGAVRGVGADEGSGALYSSPGGPNPMGLANQALSGTGIQVGPPRSGVNLPQTGPVGRFADAAGAALSNLKLLPGQGVGQYDPKTNQVSGLTPNPINDVSGAASGIHQMIAEPAQRIGSGDVAGGLGQASVNYPAAGAMMKSAADMVNLSVPSKARAQASYTDLKAQMSGQTVDTTISRMAAEAVKENAGLGGQLPKVVRDFLKKTDAGALSYAQAQKLISNASRRTAQDIKGQQLTPAARADMAKFTAALRSDITASVEQANPGSGAQYTQANREYGAAARLKKSFAETAAGGAALGGGYAGFEYLRKKLF